MNQTTNNNPMIYPLFSTPVYVRDMGSFEIPDIKSMEFTSTLPNGASHPFLTSVDKNVLDRPEFQKIHELLLAEIHNYVRGALQVSKNIEFYITNSWININRPGDQAGPHTHTNSLFSGVLYLKAPEKSGDLYFYRDTLSLVPFPPTLDLEIDSHNIYNTKHFGITPKENQVCLFPSMVMHSAGINESNEERWCLPFNIFIRGEIGDLHKLTLK